MNRTLALALHDARLQYRYGIHAAYAVVVGFYVLALLGAGGHMPGWAVAAIIYSDPAAIGFFFLGALMLLEKSERVRNSLAVAPIGATQYFAAKAVTLTLVALAACSVLLLVYGAPRPGLLLLAVTLSSVAFIGIGTPIALRFRTVNGYLIGSGAALTPILAPAALALLEPMPAWLALWPPVAQLRLILVATGHGSAGPAEIGLMLAVCLLAAVGAAALALRALRRELGK